MSKQEFLAQLRKGLAGLSQNDIEERLTFYSEMIEDRKEEGLTEEEAVLAIGSIDEIVAQAVAEVPLAKTTKEKIKPKRKLSAGEIVLLALGSPIWLSLSIAAIAVILSLYISLWAVIISLWAVFISLVTFFIGGVLSCIVLLAVGKGTSGVAMLSAGIVCAGLSIFMFYGCMATTKGIMILGKKMVILIKNCFVRKEKAA